jgi:hypothetical protein
VYTGSIPVGASSGFAGINRNVSSFDAEPVALDRRRQLVQRRRTRVHLCRADARMAEQRLGVS